MSATSLSPTRREVIAATAAAGAISMLPGTLQAAGNASVHPFSVNIPEEALVDLRRRLAATRWPTKELVEDRSQGVQMATLRELVRYWTTDHDWRACESRLNAVPQFTTEIDGVDIHFIHVRSRHQK